MPTDVFVIVAAVLASAVLAELWWFVHVVRVGIRDSMDLAVKLAVPHPCRAADWPELRLESVVVDPDGDDTVLVCARWPAHPERCSILTLEIDTSRRATALLAQWRDIKAPVSVHAVPPDRVLLRRRRSQDAVEARVVKESL